MRNIVFGACVALACTVVAGAQGKDKMATEHAGHMAAAQTYSGCVERQEDGTFALTHVMAAKKKKAGGAAGMKDDGMKDDGMKDDGMKMMMTPERVHLSSTSTDLATHVGQKVSVTGSHDDMGGMAGLAVTSLKVVAKSCR